jgi:hypothetical protein
VTFERATDGTVSQVTYRRFGLVAHAGGTYLARFRAIAAAYPGISRERVLRDLIQQSPGDEGKWFTAAKELGMYDLALELVRNSPCDPKTLSRAAGTHAERHPEFAEGAGLAALRWLVQGFGYEITSLTSSANLPIKRESIFRSCCPPCRRHSRVFPSSLSFSPHPPKSL